MNNEVLNSRTPNPKTTIAIILGASEFPKYKSLEPGLAFQNSASRFMVYLLNSDGLGLPPDNVKWLFDDSSDPNQLDEKISEWLEEKLNKKQENSKIQDLLIYYVGHGFIDTSEGQAYCLAIQRTRENNVGVSSIRFSSLVKTIDNYARHIRVYYIVDACFSGRIIKQLQTPVNDYLENKIEELPFRGITVLCSSSSSKTSLVQDDGTITMFSDALFQTLENGDPNLKRNLTFNDIHDKVWKKIKEKHREEGVRPVIDSPRQDDGELQTIQFFPNIAFRRILSEEERKQEKKRAELNARKIKQEEVQLLKETALKEAQAKEIQDQFEAEEKLKIQEELDRQKATKENLSIEAVKEREVVKREAEEILDYEPDKNILKKWLKEKADNCSLDIEVLNEEIKPFKSQEKYYEMLVKGWGEDRSRALTAGDYKRADICENSANRDNGYLIAYRHKINEKLSEIRKLEKKIEVYNKYNNNEQLDAILEILFNKRIEKSPVSFASLIENQAQNEVDLNERSYQKEVDRKEFWSTAKSCLGCLLIVIAILALIGLCGWIDMNVKK